MMRGWITTFARRVASAARLARRDPRAFSLGVRMACWVVVVAAAARFRTLPAMVRLSDTRRRWPATATLPPDEIARQLDRVLRAGFVSDGFCWKRATVLRRFLLLNGIETSVVFGVRRAAEGGIGGHAWLERDGRPYLEDDEPRHYVETFRHPSAQ